MKVQPENSREGGTTVALHLYTGSSGSGKSCALYREIIDQSIKNPKDRFFVIVPEQFSMQAQ